MPYILLPIFYGRRFRSFQSACVICCEGSKFGADAAVRVLLKWSSRSRKSMRICWLWIAQNLQEAEW